VTSARAAAEHAPADVQRDASSRPDAAAHHGPFLSRREHFRSTASTNDVVAGWLADGADEVCLATADEQSHGRGRAGRAWQAPTGSGLLLSLGFRPTWLGPERTWQLGAIVPLAMAEAAEMLAGLAPGAIRCKWPNDLVIESPRPATSAPNAAARLLEDASRRPAILKLAGVLGETSGLGTDDVRAVIGIGINVDWRRDDFPPDLAAGMTSLRDTAGGAVIDRGHLLDAFIRRLESHIAALRADRFPDTEWQTRQITTGRLVDLVGEGQHRVTVRALRVDPASGGLVVAEGARERVVHAGEIVHVRLAEPSPTGSGNGPAGLLETGV